VDTEVAAQQSDLPGMQHLMVGAPLQRQQFCLRKGMRVRNRLVEFGFVQARQFPKRLFMHPVQH